ncbi:hypothetical protein [Coraliomargarita akajimensis]|uniref:Uncharacterized protein n=1 Tax=Coraliomargarita akajimensis (strain DSM 45221 / IAM 15411 / JCM 23193 / KCTC 12865 / 04OKA010-24) TaxID=583355 RepID=D5ELZ8_CORAD|nr:hypothetical protein [Coraliomargarita akajimensis]ADE55158.1 hypothetical protein Caka_2140 [Coraliomargarita akajimensis DSM 45221]
MKPFFNHLQRLTLCLLAACGGTAVHAQNADPLVYTVGKTFETNAGSTLHDYVLWQPGDATTIFGKRFGIYAKNGTADSANDYSLLGIQELQYTPSAIQALLKLGSLIDADSGSLPMRIVALNAEAQAVPLPEDFAYPSEINYEVAQKLAQIMTIALSDAEVLQSLVSLGRAHPGVQMCLGLGFAIEVQPASLVTYEIREIDGSNTDIRVIGRVTLDADNPQFLLPPDPPRQVFHVNDPNLQNNASPKDHLNVLTRWGTPEDLRILLPHTYGFNLYRIAKFNLDQAAVSPNSLLTEDDLLGFGGVRVNRLPAVASALLTDLEAADPSFDEGNFFYGDDNDAPDPGFEDGDQFYYYVAARDIAGHPGPLSPPSLLITVCDRLPPPAPSIVSVDNIFEMASADPLAGTGTQYLQVVIEQLPDEPDDRTASEYRIYRWHAASDWMRLGADPEFNYIGSVPHVPGQRYAYFDDNDPADFDLDGLGGKNPNDPTEGADTGSPLVTSEKDDAMGKTFWYTVRAVDTTACTPQNYSGHSGATYGVPRDRVGPDKPTGSLITCFCIPEILLANEGESTRRLEYGLSERDPGFIIRVRRTELESGAVIKKIKSFDVEYGEFDAKLGAFKAQFSTTYYYKGFEPYGDVVIPIADEDGKFMRARARLGDGSVSDWRIVGTLGLVQEPTSITRYDFRAYVEICCPTLITSAFLRNDEGDIEQGVLDLLPESTGNQDCPPWIEVLPGLVPYPHTPIGPDDSITGVCGNVYLSEGVREVRVYRRVEGSPEFQLISRESSESDFDPIYFWKESAPTLVNGTSACYFAQVFDEHGNGSALVRLGCVTIQNEDLGIPMLMDPVALDPEGNLPVVQLAWFCDPVGIDRFEVWVAAAGDDEPGVDSAQLSLPVEVSSNPTLTDENGETLSFTVFRTNSLQTGFGNNGEYSINLTVPAGKKLYYAVRGIGQQVPDPVSGEYEYTQGDFSNIVSDLWIQPPSGPQDVIPWPARPLPDIAGVGIPVDSYVPTEGPFFAYPIPSNAMNDMGASAAILVGVFPATRLDNELTYEASFPSDRDPLEWLFNYRKQNTEALPADALESIVPFVVYRYQVDSTRFPNAQPNLVQVTPLIDRISYQTLTDNQNGVQYFRARDPFFIFRVFDQSWPSAMPVPLSGEFSRDTSTFVTGVPTPGDPANPEYLKLDTAGNPFESTMWIRDVIPASRGASYQYLLVHFTERGEISRIIPTNTITHP